MTLCSRYPGSRNSPVPTLPRGLPGETGEVEGGPTGRGETWSSVDQTRGFRVQELVSSRGQESLSVTCPVDSLVHQRPVEESGLELTPRSLTGDKEDSVVASRQWKPRTSVLRVGCRWCVNRPGGEHEI